MSDSRRKEMSGTDLAELTAYARNKYSISVQSSAASRGLSVLSDPKTGKAVAVLLRQWDGDAGEYVELCDIRCGCDARKLLSASFVSPPFYMQGENWIGVRFTDETDPRVVQRLFDQAMNRGVWQNFTIVLGNAIRERLTKYTETRIPNPPPDKEPVKRNMADGERFRAMMRLYKRSYDFYEGKVRNFYVQGKFMEDYQEDDAPYRPVNEGRLVTYHDLNIGQLRGYFCWRTRIRRGVFEPISESLAYMYIYELLNGIGPATPEDGLRRLREFAAGYAEAGYGGADMPVLLKRWTLEYAVVNNLPPEIARQYADPSNLERDAALTVLRNPQAHDDEEVFGALTAFMSEKKKQSLPFQEADGRRLLARAWRRFLAVKLENTPFFTACFGRRASIVWHPFSAAIYKSPTPLPDTEYVLNECRSFVRRNGQWKEKCYHTLYRDKNLLDGFIHEGDRLLRAYLGLKHPLKQRPQDLWMTPIFEDVIRAYDSERAEARKPKITIRFDDLERIRRDAIATRDSLLTDEDSAEAPPAIPAHDEAGNAAPRDMGKEAPVSPLSALQVQVLRAILRGESVKDLLRSSHEMPELFADALNEALFDDLSDTAVVCENDDILPVEDYRDDIIRILGGT